MYSRNWVGTRMELSGTAVLTEYSYGKTFHPDPIKVDYYEGKTK